MTFEEYLNGIEHHTGPFTKYRKISHLGEMINNHFVYKYLDIDTAIRHCLTQEHNSIKFSQLSQWPDKYEERFYNAKYNNIIRAREYSEKIPRLFACCFTTTPASEPSWKTYSYNKSGRGAQCVQFKINLRKLRKALNEYVEDKYDIYEAPLFYRKDYDISTLHYQTINGHNNAIYDLFFNDFNRHKYLALLSLKRDAFKYENEMRYFIIPKNQANLEDNLYVEIAFSEFVEGIMITEDCPIDYERQLIAALEENNLGHLDIQKFDLYKTKDRQIRIGDVR